MKEFFGIGGYTREPSGYLSWQHLTFVGFVLLVMTLLAIFLGIKNRNKPQKQQNKVLIWCACLILGFDCFENLVFCYNQGSLEALTRELPLFLCSIQLFTIPLAAFTKGRLKEASLDFVAIFGIMGAILGTVGAGQNYNCYPVLSFINVVSAITHGISGFTSLYVLITKMAKLKKKNILITCSIVSVFCIMAYVVNRLIDYNYMFLMAGDGTPYDILYNLVGGSKVWYPLGVVALFFLYIGLFYGGHFLFSKKGKSTPPPQQTTEEKQLQKVQ